MVNVFESCRNQQMHHFAIASPFVVLDGNISAAIAQLGERQTEDLKVPGSIPGLGILRKSILHIEALKRVRC